jgi:hypothetical protein
MLSGPKQLEWRSAFFAAFSEPDFKGLMLYRLDDPIENYATEQTPLPQAIGTVITRYSQRDEEDRLIAAAIEARPRNSALFRLARERGAAAAPTDDSLERLIRDTNSFLNFPDWLERAARIQVCVCRIEIAAQTAGGRGKVFGTGVLVGDDRVMTNYHVMQCVAATEDNDSTYQGPRASIGDVICRFDYKELADGTRTEGSRFTLDPNWRVALSPNNPFGREPTLEELDFAVIRLARAAGALTVGEKPSSDIRGYLKLSDVPVGYRFALHSPLFIVQHPEGQPIQLALETNAIESVNSSRTRVRYATNTERGSSGSPCFDQNWNLVALHHSGDPNFEHQPQYNEGIPMDSIVATLRRMNILIS